MMMRTSSNTDNFHESDRKGKVGEQKTIDFYQRVYGITLHKAETDYWRSADVDFLSSAKVANMNEQPDSITESMVLKIETKTDTSAYKNFAVEITGNCTKKTLGWTYITRADYIVSMRPALNKILILDAKMLKHFTFRFISHYPQKKMNTYDAYHHNKILYSNIIAPVPIRHLLGAGVVTAIYDYESYKLLWSKEKLLKKAV